MNEISFEDFKDQGGNPVAGVAADEIQYYRLGDELGFIGKYDDEYLSRVLRPATPYNGEYRIDDGKRHSRKEKAEEWLKNQ